MFSGLSPEEKDRVRKLTVTRERNNEFGWLISDYLNRDPCFITKELMDSVNPDGILSEEAVYVALLTGCFGLDPESNERDRQLANDYLRRTVKKLDPATYYGNPYYRDIRISETIFGDWELKYLDYKPYEAFIYNDLLIETDGKEIPRLGFFDEVFRFPAVMEHGHEWMAIKPNEIETMQPVVDLVEGRVVTFGLGLGYFTYMASLKEEVKHITVVERDNDVIQLFKRFLYPQFQHQEKVEIVSADAFEYIEKQMPEGTFDYAFVDLWHDVSDGLELYIRMKKKEYLHRRTKFFYWIEESLLAGFRWQVFDWIVENANSYQEIVKCLSKPFLQKMSEMKMGVWVD